MADEENNSKKREYEEDICSLQDVIDSEKENADIATAVLAGSDATNCSYDNGYITRQALYGCATCFKETNELNGICLACSYSCHQNHDLIELYTKRNFRCDCGNKKFSKSSTNQCKLKAQKDDFNELNKYNHNFKGLYCTCDRPYPDDELDNNNNNDEEDENENDEDTMIQCTICEDWFHTRHLLGYSACQNVNDNYDEMICHLCMNNNKFLWYYQGYIAVKTTAETSNNEIVDIENDNQQHDNKLDENICKLQQLKDKYSNLKSYENQTCYFLNGWRDALCRCNNCLKLYSENEINYLINNEDTIKFYEEKGKQEEEKKKVDENTLITNELSKMNHVSQLTFLSNLNDFKQELKDFLSNFAANGEIVKRENIENFFDQLQQRKKQKISVDYYCK